MRKLAIFILIALCFAACHQPGKVVSKTSKIHMIDSTLDAQQDTQYLAYIAPIKADLEKQLDQVIGHAPEPLAVFQPECPMLNWATDALLAMARKYSPEPVDIAVVNIGGMRCSWGQGDITLRHVFELMPFDNELVVLTLTGQDLMDLCKVFAITGGEGAAGMQITVKADTIEALVGDKAIDPTASYKVATSDYLSQGNDGMEPLKNSTHTWKSDRKIRDLYIEHIELNKVVEAHVDGRFVIEK